MLYILLNRYIWYIRFWSNIHQKKLFHTNLFHIDNMPIIQIGDVGEENKELSIISSESHSDNQQNILNIEHLHSKENNANVKSYIIHSEWVHHTIEDWEEEVKSMPIIDSNLLLESFKIHKNTGWIDFATNAESPFIQKIYGSNKIKDSIINNNEEIIWIQNN